MKNNKTSSYSSAGVFPVKLLQCKEVLDKYQRIVPIHIQLNLTNKCNLSCSFCSCQNRDKAITMPYENVKKVIDIYARLGCQAISITGGGESTLHPKIDSIIKYIKNSGINIGLVTNGININTINDLNLMTWIRVSFDDSRNFSHDFKHRLILAVNKNHEVDWSFSYVVTKAPNFDQIVRVIEFANDMAFTHVRLVSDLLDLDNVVDMDYIKHSISRYVEDDKVIYQGRKEFTHGRKKCLISLLKPVITVEGEIYPCCGVMYSHKDSKYDYDKTMCMGTVEDIQDIFSKQQNFNGSNCDRCYYDGYNEVLNNMTTDLKHKEFV